MIALFIFFVKLKYSIGLLRSDGFIAISLRGNDVHFNKVLPDRITKDGVKSCLQEAMAFFVESDYAVFQARDILNDNIE